MFFIVFFCVNLFLLQLSVAEFGYQGSEGGQTIQHREITLLGSNNPTHQLLNTEFIEKCSSYYTIFTENGAYNGILETLKMASGTTVINLYLLDYYDYEDNDDVKKHLEYAGDLNKSIECNVTNKTNPRNNCGQIVKVISKSAIAEEIFDFVDTIEVTNEVNGEVYARENCLSVFGDRRDLKTVLLCMEVANEKYAKVHIEPLKLLITSMDYCKEYMEKYRNILAVLAPKPFETDSEYSVPVIFYTPYMYSKLEENFSNSVALVKWQLLKHAILKFLNLMEWQRVVVVSDNTFDSIEFENDLTALLYKEKIVYMVIRCEEPICDMKKVAKSLRDIKARIVIVNAEANNANYLIRIATINSVWLLRDISADIKESNVQRLFGFSWGASGEESRNWGLNENILNGISSISMAYNSMKNKMHTLSKLEFHRQFLKEIKKLRYPQSTAFYVDQQRFSGFQRISSMLVSNNATEVISFKDPFANGHKPLDGPSCWPKSWDYFNYCEDELVIQMMFVIILFAITVLLITYYFHKGSPFHDIRYQYV